MGIGITPEMAVLATPFLLGLFLLVTIGTKKFATKENPNGLMTKKGRIASAIVLSVSIAVSALWWYLVYGKGSGGAEVKGALITIGITEVSLWVCVLIIAVVFKLKNKRK
ncbi:hypothetical protein E4O03_11045 [Treponema sp. OMZ 792]|uniref:hypothetical protein n=1 Tax=unclassified Treponema TaxID=2638727 RepID=UPI0020A3DD42|nr:MULTISPECIES: hypothetical protein [unclassified Treponema]UTC74723.1 hypothetical protein E4O03_11045 [Treponema sp. OMZ 792]UTC76945.1 hypothetical protein E4O04_02525 [Treponema sp. OMZ 799]UTC81117.1 hypothetical protein E4O07_10945 [Treponema sp. OMZ 798]